MKNILTEKEIKWLAELVTVLEKMPDTLSVGQGMNIFKDIEFVTSLPRIINH